MQKRAVASNHGRSISLQNSISAMRNQRKKAIDLLDFEMAEQITEEIEIHKSSASAGIIAQIKEEFTPDITSCIERSYDLLDELSREKEEKEKVIRFRYHRIFKDIQRTHMGTFEDLETKYADARSRENDRRVPQQFHLLELAKKAATNGQFKEAISLRDQSRVVAQQDLEKRLQAVDEDFDNNRSRILAQQRVEIIQLVQRLQSELQTLEETMNGKYAQANSNRDKQLIALYNKYSSRVRSSLYEKEANMLMQDLQNEFLAICTAYECECPEQLQTIMLTEPSHKSQISSQRRSQIASRSSRRQ